ncbi:MAG TPA: sensor domain-containing diguanylate cyclase [Kineosporiaceae bacterium]|nr:sensor domain-containing diguanylate cyclase [Kineosporiaceae bacterium]
MTRLQPAHLPSRPPRPGTRRRPAGAGRPTRPAPYADLLGGQVHPGEPPSGRGTGADEHADRFYRDVLDQLHEAVYFVDTRRRITFWNRGAERLTGRPAAQVLGIRCPDGVLEHVDERDRPLCGRRCPLLTTMRDRAVHEDHVFLRHADGHRIPVTVRAVPIFDDRGRVLGAVETFSDDTRLADARARIDEPQDENLRDPLTGLGNRRLAELRLEASLAEVRTGYRRRGVMFIDVDHFTRVNDRHGHAAGDLVLATVARTLRSALRRHDLLARWGGGEFVAVLLDVDPDRLAAVAERLRALIARTPVPGDDGDITVTVSVGATMIHHRDDRAGLVDRADALMYRSKAEGRNRVTVEGPRRPAHTPDPGADRLRRADSPRTTGKQSRTS